MTIKTDHINIDRSEDPGYWYIWSLEFNNTFRTLFTQPYTLLKKKSYNIDTDPPFPSSVVMWVIYAHTLELYMKTYLLAQKLETVKTLKSRTFSHDLEKLRRRCAETNNRFNNKDLSWITQDLYRFTKLDWEFIKYPPSRPPLKNKSKSEVVQHSLPMYGPKTMLPPLDFLESIVKPLVYVKD